MDFTHNWLMAIESVAISHWPVLGARRQLSLCGECGVRVIMNKETLGIGIISYYDKS